MTADFRGDHLLSQSSGHLWNILRAFVCSDTGVEGGSTFPDSDSQPCNDLKFLVSPDLFCIWGGRNGYLFGKTGSTEGGLVKSAAVVGGYGRDSLPFEQKPISFLLAVSQARMHLFPQVYLDPSRMDPIRSRRGENISKFVIEWV